MNSERKITAEYRRHMNQLKAVLRGKYPEIAKRSRMKLDTVRAVMNLKFRNDKILSTAESLALELNESKDNSKEKANAA